MISALVTALLLVVDALGSAAALLVWYTLKFGTGFFNAPVPSELDKPLLVLTGFWWLLFALRGMYRNTISIVRFDEISDIFKTVVIGIVVIFIATFDLEQPLRWSRLLLLTYGLLVFLFVVVGRMTVREFQVWLRQRGRGLWNAAVVGVNPVGMRLKGQLESQPVWGYRVLGFIRGGEDAGVEDATILGGIDELPGIIANHKLHCLLIAPQRQSPEELLRILDRILNLRVHLMLVADYHQMAAGLAKAVKVHGLPLLELVPPAVPLLKRFVKRCLDIVVSIALLPMLILAVPLALVSGLSGGGKPVTGIERVGRREKPFRQLWFCTAGGGDDEPGGVAKRILKRFWLNRLPQLVNVLKGDMSLVGPEAVSPETARGLAGRVPLYRRRFLVRPGVTGWTQIRYGLDIDRVAAVEGAEYDLYYINNLSPALDIWIMLGTVKRVLQGRI